MGRHDLSDLAHLGFNPRSFIVDGVEIVPEFTFDGKGNMKGVILHADLLRDGRPCSTLQPSSEIKETGDGYRILFHRAVDLAQPAGRSDS